MDWDGILHVRCLPQATHTLTHMSVHRYDLGGRMRFHVEQFSYFPGWWWKGWAQPHPKRPCHPKQLQSPDIPTNFNVAPSHFALWLSHIVVHHFTHCLYTAFSLSQELVWLAVIFGVQMRSLFLSATILWIYTSFPITQLKHESTTAVAQDWWQMAGLSWGQEGRTGQRYKTLW